VPSAAEAMPGDGDSCAAASARKAS
jgi:hypothetical protein